VAGTPSTTPAAAATAEPRRKNCLRLVGSIALLLGVTFTPESISKPGCGSDDAFRNRCDVATACPTHSRTFDCLNPEFSPDANTLQLHLACA
jgi:hypothetical protein